MSKYHLPFKAEIDLEIDRPNTFQIDASEEWQSDIIWAAYYEAEQLKATSLAPIERIREDWYDNLTEEERETITRKNRIPNSCVCQEWIKFWRAVGKTPELRSIERSHENGAKVGTSAHFWAVWIAESFYKYLDEIEETIVRFNDEGLSHAEIGFRMLEIYGEKFYSPRKGKTKGTTTPAKIVNYFFSQKIPVKIAKATLLEYYQWKNAIEKKQEKGKKESSQNKFTYHY